MRKIVGIIAVIFLINMLSAQTSQDYIELLKTNLQTGKKALIIQNMQFSEEESEKFWPIYDGYEKEMMKLTDRRIKNIKKFAENYESLNDEIIDEILAESLSIAEGEIALDKKYYNEFKKVLTTRRAAKFVQLMNQIEVAIDFQITSQIPLIDTKPVIEEDSEGDKKPAGKKL